jgi:hypothetical protein
MGTLRPKKPTKRDKQRAQWRRHMRTYRAKQRSKHLGQPTAVSFSFDDSTGVIRSSDLDALGSFVGSVDAAGRFLAESTRHSASRWLSALQEAVQSGQLRSPRWARFLAQHPSP